MSSIFKRSVPPSPAASLKTETFVVQLSKQLQSYAAAADVPGQQAVVAATRQLFAQFERSKSGPQAVDLQRPGASLKPAKLDSLARKLAQTQGYSADATAAFVALVSPILAGRLGLVSTAANEADMASAAHAKARATLAQASQDAAALVACAKQAGADEAAALVRAAGGESAAIKGALIEVRGEIAQLHVEREALDAECAAIESKRAAYFAAIPNSGVGFKAGGTTFHIGRDALEESGYLSSMASAEYSERPDRSGAIKVSDITADQLQAVIEFLEEDEISGLETYNKARLLKVAQRFGSEAMEAYVQDPGKYRAEQTRLSRLDGVDGASAIPAGYVRIEAGEFTMGSPADEVGRYDNEVPHVVQITQPFLLKQTPVTQAQWQALMDNNPSRFSQGAAGQRPVEMVSWYDAVAYCNALSAREGLSPCYVLHGALGTPGQGDYHIERVEKVSDAHGYRLPTEAEWEYAARGGSTEATHGPRGEVAWFDENAGYTTHPVGQKTANAVGLHDMLGNVWEWTADWHGPLNNTLARDPQGADTGAYRVVRGGSFRDPARYVRAAYRGSVAPDERYGLLGLRPARSDD